MARWGASHHSLKSNALQSTRAAKKTAEMFVQKIDPHRILFLEEEVTDLRNQVLASWDSFLNQKNCSVFDSWFNNHIQSVKKRFIQQATLFSEKNLSLAKRNKASKTSNTFNQFAKNVQELSQRQNKIIQEWVDSTPLEVLKSYRNHKELFVRERAEQILATEQLNGRVILAKAVLGSLDPYSTYYSKSEFKEFYDELSGESAGVGIRVQKSLKGLWVEETIPESPAQEAGIKKGDLIVKINDQSIEKMSFNEATELLKGAKDTAVNLTIASQNRDKTISLTRSESAFQDKKVGSEWLATAGGKKIFVITIPSFYGRGGMGQTAEEDSSSDDVKTQLERLKKSEENFQAVVLDLRGNPGGYLEEAVAMAGLFLGSETVVGVKDQTETRVITPEESNKPVYDGPLVVLVDKETASAGEVLAAALKDHQRALLVGTSATYGKGSVQKLFQLDDPFLDLGTQAATGVIKLTTSVFYSPLGHSPANGGVTTQIQLGESEEKNSQHHSLLVKVEDISPLVGPSTLEKLQQREPLLQQAISALELNKSSTDLLARTEADSMMRNAVELAGNFSESSFEILRQSETRKPNNVMR